MTLDDFLLPCRKKPYKALLKKAFPHIKFRIHGGVVGGGMSIYWTNGPSEKRVKAFLRAETGDMKVSCRRWNAPSHLRLVEKE